MLVTYVVLVVSVVPAVEQQKVVAEMARTAARLAARAIASSAIG